MNTFNFSIILIAVSIVLVVSFVFMQGSGQYGYMTEKTESPSLEVKFAQLSAARTNSCGGTFDYVGSLPDDSRIQGSCCSAMNFHRYSEQVEGLKKYSSYDKIPKDPYDVEVGLARELLDYQKNIVLTTEEQAVYDEAVNMSHEGGPCCCKCWHWYAYEGLAKYLITENGFTAEQVADVWDLSDACGGAGHINGEDHG